MIIVLKPNVEEEKYKQLEKRFREDYGLDIHFSRGEKSTILGLVGDTSKVDIEAVRALDIVDSVTPIQEPYKAANRKFHPMDSVIEVGGVKIGGGNFVKIAGPCSVETIEQITGRHYELDDFQIQAVTEGREAMGSTLVKLRSNGKLYSGNGISTDIIGSSIRAYLNALNKISYEENNIQ